MADQQPNPYAPTRLTGPFADMLDPTIASAPHESNQQFSGWEGKTGKVLGIADKFLAGLGQGRMMAALAAEKEKAKTTSALMGVYEQFDKDPLIDPVTKAQFGQKVQQTLFSDAAESIKKTKGQHPILDAMGHIITGLAGGEVKKSKQDPKAMQSLMGEMAAARVEAAKKYAANSKGGEPLLNAISEEIKAAQDSGKGVNHGDITANILAKHPDLIAAYDRQYGKDSGIKFINDSTQRLAAPPAEAKLTPAQQRQKDLDQRMKGGQGQPQPPGAGLYPTDLTSTGQTGQGTLGDALGGSVDTPLRKKYGAETTKPGLPPPPPGTQVPKLTNDAREYLQAYNLLTAPKEMNVDGKKKQVIYTNGDARYGIEPGFVDAQTGEYIHGQIASTDKKSNPPMRLAHDDKKKYGGGDYYINEDTGKPLRDADGDIVRPREQATSTGQKAVNMAIEKEYDTYTAGLNALDKEAQSNIMRISSEKDAMGQPRYQGKALEDKKKEIYDGIIKRKAGLKDQARNKIQNLGNMFGVPVQPFMTDEQRQAIGDPDQSEPDKGFEFPSEVGADDAAKWDFK